MTAAGWIKPGPLGTGRITIVAGNKHITGTSTNFDPQLTVGDTIYYSTPAGTIASGVIDSIASDTSAELVDTPTASTGSPDDGAASTPFNYVADPVTTEVVGEDGFNYVLRMGANLYNDGYYKAALYCPGNAYTAATTGTGWVAAGTPLGPIAPTFYTEDKFMQAPSSAELDVVGQDGVNYNLVPWTRSPYTDVQTVPAPAVAAAEDAGWTIL